jgi:hypothetical protein
MKDRTFYLLCIGEVLVILAGEVGILVAAFLQAILIAHLFRSVSFSSRTETGIFLTVFLIPLAMFIALILSLGHTLIPLLLLAIVAGITIITNEIAEYRLHRFYGGAP